MTIRLTLLITGIISLFFLAPFSLADNYAGKRILHIDSYHRGNIWNDRIADAVQTSLKDTGVTLKIIHMDTKRNPSKAFNRAAALKAKAVIDEFQPHVVTTSDDNAAKYLIMPHYKDADLPFVFCGLNWDASTYDLPYKNVTGMVEVSPVPQIIKLLKQYAAGNRLGYLTEDTKTKRKELEYHKKLFNIEYDQVYLVKTFAEWKESYLRAQDEVDMLIILGVAALTDWDDKAAQTLAENHTKIPSGTDFGWLMHISMLGVGKSAEEQGRWAAQAALKILDGVEPSRIPLTHNKEGKLYFNRNIAASMGINKAPPLATIVP
jgi:ABC-type uncharacterized transport system substrate-binding protein